MNILSVAQDACRHLKVFCKDGRRPAESSETGDSSQQTCLLDTWPILVLLKVK